MRAKLGTLNHCAVPFLSRAGANLCWYYYTIMYTHIRSQASDWNCCVKRLFVCTTVHIPYSTVERERERK